MYRSLGEQPLSLVGRLLSLKVRPSSLPRQLALVTHLETIFVAPAHVGSWGTPWHTLTYFRGRRLKSINTWYDRAHLLFICSQCDLESSCAADLKKHIYIFQMCRVNLINQVTSGNKILFSCFNSLLYHHHHYYSDHLRSLLQSTLQYISWLVPLFILILTIS